MIAEYAFGKLTDLGIEKVKGWLNEDKAQKILLQCFYDYYENNKESCYVDKDAIMKVNGDKIKPNLRPEKIIDNIKDVFKKCILTDDIYKFKSIEFEITYNYLKEANKALLELCDIDEDIHIVQDEVLENRKVIIQKHKELSKKIQDVHSLLKEGEQQILSFVNEVDNCRTYCYIVLKVPRDIENYILDEVENEAMCGATEYQRYSANNFLHIVINFVDTLCQSELKVYLEALDKVFSEKKIKIFNIFTHR